MITRAINRIRDVFTPDRDTWGSHRYLFDKLFAITGDLDIIVEDGCGDWSTFYLAQHCKDLVSYETNPKWARRIKGRCAGQSNITLLEPGESIMSSTNRIDLVFVDGPREGRVTWIKWAMEGKVPYIVIHDWEKTRHYRYHEVLMGSGDYLMYVDKTVRKQTALFTTNLEVFGALA